MKTHSISEVFHNKLGSPGPKAITFTTDQKEQEEVAQRVAQYLGVELHLTQEFEEYRDFDVNAHIEELVNYLRALEQWGVRPYVNVWACMEEDEEELEYIRDWVEENIPQHDPLRKQLDLR